MQTYLVSYGSPQFNLCLLRLSLKARKHGVDALRLYTPTHIRNTDFYQRHQHILCQPRGAGYWLWKPYIILQTMKEARDGDVIIYCDPVVELLSIKTMLTQLDRQDIFLVKNYACWEQEGCMNSKWTKRDTFILMDADYPRYWDAPQVSVTPFAVRNGETTRRFVSEWLTFCKDERILTDIPNTQGKDNHLGFIDHRHDQSVLSILAERYHIDLAAHGAIDIHRRIDYGIPMTVWLFLRNYHEGMTVLRQLYGTQPWRILQLGFHIMILWWLPISLYPPSYIELGKKRRLTPPLIMHIRTRVRVFVLGVLKVLKFRM